jgi:hypothetical protein
MFTTLPADRIHLPGEACSKGEILSATVLVPPDVGLLMVDLCWSEGTEQQRTQGMLFPATVDSVSRIYMNEPGICGMAFIPAARHDGSGRDPSVQIDAIDLARDPKRGFAQVLLVRDIGGEWHGCNPDTRLETLEDRVELLRLNEFV